VQHRFLPIDFLRSVAIFGVIVTHVYSYNLTNPTNYFIWNYLHFVVVAFVFCSGFVMTAKYKHFFIDMTKTLVWYRKRFIRLLVPFYIYLFTHYTLWFLFPHFFSGLGLEKSSTFLLQSLLLIGGVNLNWLPLLFIQLAFLFPLFTLLVRKRNLVICYLAFAILVTLFFTIQTSTAYSYYRFVMWIPWSLILLTAMYFYSKEKEKINSKKYVLLIAASFAIFIILFMLFQTLHRSLTLIDHKYPPDFYYLSYATCMTLLVYSFSKIRILEKSLISKIYVFISQQAYPLFFIHYIVSDNMLQIKKSLAFLSSPITQTVFVLIISISISYLIQKAKALIFSSNG